MNNDLATLKNSDIAIAVYDTDFLCDVSIYIIKNWTLLFKDIYDVQMRTIHGKQ